MAGKLKYQLVGHLRSFDEGNGIGGYVALERIKMAQQKFKWTRVWGLCNGILTCTCQIIAPSHTIVLHSSILANQGAFAR